LATDRSLSEKINKSLEYNADKTVYFLDKMNLWKHIPITEALNPYYIKRLGSGNAG
jgi:hypothetical protein